MPRPPEGNSNEETLGALPVIRMSKPQDVLMESMFYCYPSIIRPPGRPALSIDPVDDVYVAADK